MITVAYGSEISWTLGSCESEGGYDDNGEYTQQCCLGRGNYNLECKDSYGDGWHGGYIELNSIKYCEGFTSGTEETSQIIVQDGGKNSVPLLYSMNFYWYMEDFTDSFLMPYLFALFYRI